MRHGLEHVGNTLRGATRFVALELAGLDVQAGQRVLADLVERLDTVSSAECAVALDDLLQHLEVMSAGDQRRCVRRWHELHPDDVAGLARLLNRLPVEVRTGLATELAVALPTRLPRALPSAGGRADMPVVALVVPAYLSAETFLQPPVGMLLAAARLRRLGYRVRLVDNRVRPRPPEDLVADVADAAVIVVTTTPYDHIQNYFLDYRLRHALRTVDVLKAGAPGATLVVCGAHGTVRADLVLRDCRADLILKGEYDAGLPPLVEAVVRHDDLSGAGNVVTRDAGSPALDGQGGSGVWRVADLRRGPQQVDDTEIVPAYDLIDFDDYYGDVYVENQPTRVTRWGAVLATRGCAFDCSFCYNFWDRRVRYRDPEAVAQELHLLQEKHAVQGLFFVDFHFTQNKNWVLEFCRAAQELDVRIPWSAQARSDSVPDEVLAAMAAAGCRQLWFGVESFDPGVVATLAKYRDADVARSAIDRTAAAGIRPHLFIMIGVPGETRESITTTLGAMHELGAPYCGVMPAAPRFGTRYYGLAKEQFPQLGDDFYGLRAVRGLVANDLGPADLDDAVAAFADRSFLYAPTAPQLASTDPRERARD